MICNLVAVSPAELAELIRHPDRVIDVFFPNNGEGPRREESCDLDKRWHGLHYLFTGDPWEGEPPLWLAIFGGVAIGDDTGYGPPRYLTPEEVKDVAAALNRITQNALTTRFDPDAMNEVEIYPACWDANWLRYLLEGFTMLQTFYRTAAAKGRAVLTCIS
jgi:hypothetical protein